MALRPVDEVVEHLLSKVRPLKSTEVRPLAEALDCCLAENIVSPVNVPPADNSAMDGYALAFDATLTQDVYEVSDRIPAGSVGSRLKSGTVARIFTGAEIPEGADTVVMQENTASEGEAVRIIHKPAKTDNVRSKGQDILFGATILKAGSRLSPRALSLIASVGIPEVSVKTPLKIAILSTGDELVEPGGHLKPGQIFNSNRYALAGLIRKIGMIPVDFGIVADTPEATDDALMRAAMA
ncbi:MAG: molybdopterin molybdotransferase, partial [Candidatus Azotimanducaceae bacterium]